MRKMRKGWLWAALALAAAILGTGLLAFKALTGPATASSWRIEVVDNAGNVGEYTSIALDKNGWPHISYYDATNGDLKYARWTGESWEIETVDNKGNVGQYTSIALDSNDRPHISYFDAGNGHLKHAQWSGSEWRIEKVDNGDNVGLYTSIAIDSDDCSHISYYDRANGDLKYAQWTGSEWRIEVVDNENDVGVDTSIALDSADLPHISYDAYVHPNDRLKYARWAGSEWEIEIVDDPLGVDSTGRFTSIALDVNDHPCISYAENPLRMDVNPNLKYARWTGEVWEIERVEGTRSPYENSVGWYTSIALDSHDCPHISYYNQWSEYDLKYAKWDGNQWRIETVDNEGDVGMFTSIAIDSNDRPHISYYDMTNEDLKYAIITGEEGVAGGSLPRAWIGVGIVVIIIIVAVIAVTRMR